MQTFLPYPDFKKSLECLDNKRLGKQRVEAMQILNSLQTPDRWSNHPAVKMWRGYEAALEVYKNLAIDLWEYKGFNNNMQLTLRFIGPNGEHKLPPWLNETFCSAHRSNLLRKGYIDIFLDHMTKSLGPYTQWHMVYDLPREHHKINVKHLNYLMNRPIPFTFWDENHYLQFGWKESYDLPYIWPVN